MKLGAVRQNAPAAWRLVKVEFAQADASFRDIATPFAATNCVK